MKTLWILNYSYKEKKAILHWGKHKCFIAFPVQGYPFCSFKVSECSNYPRNFFLVCSKPACYMIPSLSKIMTHHKNKLRFYSEKRHQSKIHNGFHVVWSFSSMNCIIVIPGMRFLPSKTKWLIIFFLLFLQDFFLTIKWI